MYFRGFLILNLPLYRFLMANLITHNYPLGLGSDVSKGQHYVLIDSYESVNALNNLGTKLSSIALYIPPNSMKTSFSANYNGMEGGALKAAGVTGSAKIAQKALGGENPVDMMKANITSMFAGATAEVERRAAGFADKKTGFLSAGLGLAVNNHIALVYQGPTEFRTHDFVFQFWPKSNPEAKVVEEILKDFQNGMLPRMSGSNAASAANAAGAKAKIPARLNAPFFRSPRHYKIKFYKGQTENPHTIKIGTSVITNMSVNHDPEGIVSFHPDGYPVHTSLTLTFKEIEFVTSDDAVDSAFDAALDAVMVNQSQAAEKKINEADLAFQGASNPGDKSGAN